MAEKDYKASTGVEEFYYAPLDETGTSIVKADPSRVKFLQNLTVEMPQEAVRAWGDNQVAEIAVSSGNISVTSAFHKVPSEDKKVLFGLEESTNGLLAHGSSDNPPYVAVVFAKTYEDGSKEWVGLTKGMFMRPNKSGSTKQETTEFSSEEITAAFMDREVNGFDDEKSVVFAKEVKGETTKRDALFQAVFGKSYPTTTTTTTTTSA
ncbi:phage major tail protein, phi13 family [Halobacillus karajensis]|uniref:major tail protein n=1 Tax=Halobacillus karajensis TaxID=195088 RepID=UPI0008A7AB7E|nr:major tail protein [Halobacillus karajensis]SEH78457.1 phage major tail protein, phi13 family [Halobacillus karajensis]